MGHKLIFEQDWKPWPKDPRILVSDEGDVLSYRSGFWKRLKQTDSGRYLTVGINNPTGKSYLVHRLVAETWIPKESEDLEVNHINGNRYDNRVENLEWVTHQENIDHSRKTGLVPKSCSTKVRIVETGELFDSEAECARAIGGHYNNISGCLHGWQKTHRGYHFERVED